MAVINNQQLATNERPTALGPAAHFLHVHHRELPCQEQMASSMPRVHLAHWPSCGGMIYTQSMVLHHGALLVMDGPKYAWGVPHLLLQQLQYHV